MTTTFRLASLVFLLPICWIACNGPAGTGDETDTILPDAPADIASDTDATCPDDSPDCSADAIPDGSMCIRDVVGTIFFKNTDEGEPFQVAFLSLDNLGEEREAVITAQIGGRSWGTTTWIPTDGLEEFEILVPPLEPGEEGTLDVTVVVSDTLAARGQFPWHHQRRWRLYLVPYCHIDVGFSNAQDDVDTIHQLNLDGQRDSHGDPTGVLDLLQASDDFPLDSRFRFTSEGSWPIIRFLENPSVPQARKEELIRRILDGRLEVAGFYLGHTNKFVGDEAMVRSTYFSAEYLAREFGVEVRSAVLNDIGDASSIVLPLAGAGIRYFQFGPNSLQFPLPALFYLRSPVADARVLVWRTPNVGGYFENGDLCLRPPPPDDPQSGHDPDAPVERSLYEPAIAEHLTWLQEHGLPLPRVRDRYEDMYDWQTDYPYDAYLVPYYPAHAGDNGYQDLTPSLIARDWNERYVFPRMIVATLSEFFEYIEAQYTEQIPEIPIDFTGYWGEQIFVAAAQIDPIKETMSRQFVELMSTAEAFSAFASVLDPTFVYPAADEIREMYGLNLLTNDHNPIPLPISGNHCPENSSSICYEDDDVERWKVTRAGWVIEPYQFARDTLADALAAIAERVDYPDVEALVVVFNPSAWPRFDVVEASIPAELTPWVLLDDGGDQVPYQEMASDDTEVRRIAFTADIPAFGYRSFALAPGEPISGGLPMGRETDTHVEIENEYYRIRVPRTMSGQSSGAIESLFDREAGRELVDSAAGVGFNQYIVLMRSQTFGTGILGDDSLQLLLPGWTRASARLRDDGPVFASIRVTGEYDPSIRVPFAVRSVLRLALEAIGLDLEIPVSTPTTLAQDIILYRGIKRVELVGTFEQTEGQVFENTLCYPFDLPQWQEIRVELPYNPIRFGGNDWAGIRGLRPEQEGDQAMASRLLLGGVNQANMVFRWIDGIAPDVVFRHYLAVSGTDFSVAFSSRDSGVVFPMQADAGPIPSHPAPMFYHLAVGPTLVGDAILGAPVDVTYTVRSALTSHPGPYDTLEGVAGHGTVARWARAFTAPLHAVVIEGGGHGQLPRTQSFAAVDETNLVMPVLKRAEDGDGYVVRLLEVAGQETDAHVLLPFLGTPLAWSLATTVERDLCLVDQGGSDEVEVHLGPHELRTLRIRDTGAPPGLATCAP